MRLDKAIDLFLGEHKPSTRRSYFYILGSMKDFMGPAREVDQIPPSMVVEYHAILHQRDYAPATVQKHVKGIKAFFNWLVKLELIHRSPATAIRRKRLRREISREKAMTDKELDAILEYARWHPRDYAMILFLADTGARAGGAAGLKVEDINFDMLEAKVTEKGDKERKVAFGELCRQAMLKWLLRRKAGAGPYVFSHTGQKMKSDNVSLVIRRICKKVGIRSLGAHSLRHRKGHQFADSRIAPSIAATALGHSSVEITLAFYYPSDWESAKSALHELAKDNKETEKVVTLPTRKRQ